MTNQDKFVQEKCDELQEILESLRPENIIDKEKIKEKAAKEKEYINNLYREMQEKEKRKKNKNK
jgi:hypothetical protein